MSTLERTVLHVRWVPRYRLDHHVRGTSYEFRPQGDGEVEVEYQRGRSRCAFMVTVDEARDLWFRLRRWGFEYHRPVDRGPAIERLRRGERDLVDLVRASTHDYRGLCEYRARLKAVRERIAELEREAAR